MNEDLNCNKRLYVRYSGGISRNSFNALIQQLQPRINTNRFHEIYLCLSSCGGDVGCGIEIYNYFKSLSQIKIITHNFGVIDSIANVIFLAGEERYASTGTSFLIHGVSFHINGQFEANYSTLNEFLSKIKQDENRIIDIFVKETELQKEDIQKLFREGESKDCEYAKRTKIINDIKNADITTQNPIINIIADNMGNILSCYSYNC